MCFSISHDPRRALSKELDGITEPNRSPPLEPTRIVASFVSLCQAAPDFCGFFAASRNVTLNGRPLLPAPTAISATTSAAPSRLLAQITTTGPVRGRPPGYFRQPFDAPVMTRTSRCAREAASKAVFTLRGSFRLPIEKHWHKSMFPTRLDLTPLLCPK